jgi:hypothetical protein
MGRQEKSRLKLDHLKVLERETAKSIELKRARYSE